MGILEARRESLMGSQKAKPYPCQPGSGESSDDIPSPSGRPALPAVPIRDASDPADAPIHTYNRNSQEDRMQSILTSWFHTLATSCKVNAFISNASAYG